MTRRYKKHKIKKEDLQELRAKNNILRHQIALTDAMNTYVRFFTNSIIDKYGLDTRRAYNVNIDKGFIQEIEKPEEQSSILKK